MIIPSTVQSGARRHRRRLGLPRHGGAPEKPLCGFHLFRKRAPPKDKEGPDGQVPVPPRGGLRQRGGGAEGPRQPSPCAPLARGTARKSGRGASVGGSGTRRAARE
eukprot:gene9343-biopygen11029